MEKEEYRKIIWNLMTEQKVGAFPFPLHNRIPNFKGANQAASLLENIPEWNNARVIKANPDSPQRYVRKLALQSNKIVYMAVPKLRERKCFVRIKVNSDNATKAASIKGSFEYGNTVHPKEMEEIDLVITGSVVVNNKGQRLGKGGGYSDLELALLYKFNLITKDIPILTTVHPLQVVEFSLPQDKHDIRLTKLITPDEIIECTPSENLPGIEWETLSEEKISSIPILQEITKKSNDH